MRLALLLLVSLACRTSGQTVEARRWADHWASVYGIQRELVYAVIEAESSWNPRAASPAGAAGLMQLMPDTAVAFRVTNRFDDAENIRAGVAYLALLRDQCGGDWRLAIASYAAGYGRVRRHGLNYDSAQLVSYVARVADLYRRNRWETLLKFERGGPA